MNRKEKAMKNREKAEVKKIERKISKAGKKISVEKEMIESMRVADEEDDVEMDDVGKNGDLCRGCGRKGYVNEL